MRLIAVAVPVPSLDALTYSVPDAFAVPSIGARVLVPLGNRVLTGIVVGIVDPAGTATSPEVPNPESRIPNPDLSNTGTRNHEPGTPNRNPEPGTPNRNPEPGTPNRNPEPGTRN